MTQLMVLDICLEARGNLFLSTSCGESRQLAYVLFHQVLYTTLVYVCLDDCYR